MSPRAEAHRRARLRVESEVGVMYVAEVVDQPLVKIGFSLAPERRVRNLAIHGVRFRLIGGTPATIREERQLHRDLRGNEARETRINVGEVYPRSILDHPAIPPALRRHEQAGAAVRALLQGPSR